VGCKSCGAPNQNTVSAEMVIHIPGLENLDRPAVWLFPRILVCMDCGFSEFIVPEDKMHFLEVEKSTFAVAGFQRQ
jgi:hypothetical protein